MQQIGAKGAIPNGKVTAGIKRTGRNQETKRLPCGKRWGKQSKKSRAKKTRIISRGDNPNSNQRAFTPLPGQKGWNLITGNPKLPWGEKNDRMRKKPWGTHQ